MENSRIESEKEQGPGNESKELSTDMLLVEQREKTILMTEMISHLILSKHFLKFFVENQLKIFAELEQKIKSGSDEFQSDPVFFFDFIAHVAFYIEIPKLKKLCP